MPATVREFPSLKTERLRLRAPDINDAEPFRVLLSLPAVTRFSNWPDAPKKAEVERVMRWMYKLHPSRNGCAWIIEDGATKTVIGAIRFNHFDRDGRRVRSAMSCTRIGGDAA